MAPVRIGRSAKVGAAVVIVDFPGAHALKSETNLLEISLVIRRFKAVEEKIIDWRMDEFLPAIVTAVNGVGEAHDGLGNFV